MMEEKKNKVLAIQDRIAQVGEMVTSNRISLKPLSELKISTDPHDRIVLAALEVNINKI